MASLLLSPAQLGAVTLALGGFGCVPGGESAPLGPLSVARPLVDFGTVGEGRVLEHEWTVAVNAPLSVREAKTDCGCTLARLERLRSGQREPYQLGTPLAAGEELLVSARYDTRGRRGPGARSVTLLCEPGAPLALSLAADVQPWLVLEPPELAFTRLLEGAGAECAFRVRAVGGEAFGLTATGVALPPWVRVEVTPEAPAADGRARAWAVRAFLGSEAPRGTYDYPLELRSDVPVPGPQVGAEPRHYSVSPSWTLQVVGPVALSVPTLEFGLVQGAETVARSLRLDSFDPAFTPSAARARLEPLVAGADFPLARTAQVHTRLAGQACEIELTLAGLAPEVTGTFLGRLVVETGHPALPRLEALVRGVRAPAGGVR